MNAQTTTKYGMFFPETGARYCPEVTTYNVQVFVDWFNRPPGNWERIEAKGDDLAAFLHRLTGDLIVIRAIVEEGAA